MTATEPDAEPALRQLSEQGVERRQQIVDAAKELFTQNGYAATRISDICDRAGIAKGLFYWYFDTKRDVFVEVATHMRRRLRTAQSDAFTPGADPLTHICEGAAATVHFVAEFANFFELIDVEGTDPSIRTALDERSDVYLDDVLALIRAGQEQGLIDDRDPYLLANGVLAAVSSVSDATRTNGVDADVDSLAEFVADWVDRALRSNGT